MRVVSLKCGHCGAPLDVPAGREQFNCDYCGSGLHLAHRDRHSPKAEDTPEQRAVTQHELKLQAALQQLDAEWEDYRAGYLSRDDSGEYVIPDPEACRMGIWVTAVLAGGAAIIGAMAGTMAIMGLAIAVGVVVVAVLLRQAKIGTVYLRSAKNYRRLRLSIVDQLRDIG